MSISKDIIKQCLLITSIGRGVLDSCYNLEEISIPDLAPFFKENPFAWCSNLKRITILRRK